jgi:isochorismate synthase
LEPTVVFFSPPQTNQLYVFKEGEGQTYFHLKAFKKASDLIVVKGSISPCEISYAKNYLNQMILPQANANFTSTQADYMEMVSRAVESIQKGKFDKVVLSAQKSVATAVNLGDAFENMLQYTSAFVYVFNYKGQVMIGASPELLMSLKHNALKTVALGATSVTDQFSAKEDLEHEQITAYIDAQLIQSGYVYEKAKRQAVKAAHLFHLQTPYTIQSKGINSDLLMAMQLHPTSAVCGWPFEPALDFIAQNESYDRQWYTGFLGLKTDTSFEYYVNLRCADVYEHQIVLYAGAGINAFSNPEAEWHEIQNKMKTVLDCF